MGLFDFFKKSKKAKRRKLSSKRHHFAQKEIRNLKTQFNTVNLVLQKHEKEISENTTLLKEHSLKLKTLEDILAKSATNQPTPSTNLLERPVSTIKPVQTNVNNKFDIDRFSQQEKKILSVFFNHQDMALSYRDIASTLGKAPNTIKNQIHQILLKADIFEKSIDTGMVNRFRLKDGLKIEKYLTNRAD
jgi:DNA-binding NarL/FixJ family response regulator